MRSHLLEYQGGILIPTHDSSPFEFETVEAILEASHLETLQNLIPRASSNHVTIVGNLYFLLRDALKSNQLPYRVFPDGVHLFVAPENYRVPGTVIAQRPAAFNEKDHLTNPLVIFEVGSPSTFRKDQGEKLRLYTALETLQVDVLVSKDEKLIQRYLRRDTTGQYDFFTEESEAVNLIPKNALPPAVNNTKEPY